MSTRETIIPAFIPSDVDRHVVDRLAMSWPDMHGMSCRCGPCTDRRVGRALDNAAFDLRAMGLAARVVDRADAV